MFADQCSTVQTALPRPCCSNVLVPGCRTVPPVFFECTQHMLMCGMVAACCRWVLTLCPTAPPARATTKCASSWGERAFRTFRFCCASQGWVHICDGYQALPTPLPPAGVSLCLFRCLSLLQPLPNSHAHAHAPCSYYGLKPDIKVIAPWREWDLNSRTRLIAYAEQHGLAVPAGGYFGCSVVGLIGCHSSAGLHTGC